MRLRSILLFCYALLIVPTVAFAQEIPYGTGNWNRDELGNHRAVITVTDDAEAVRVHIPWRRLDDPAKRSLIVLDAATGKKIDNVYPQTLNKEYGDIIFEPATGKGLYFLYYMPFKVTGSWYFPNTVYPAIANPYDPQWLKRAEHPGEAKVIRFESINDFNSFYPMEIPATQQETDGLLEKNNGKDLILFTEDRKYPIRMENHIPAHWIKSANNDLFSGVANRNEFFVFQLGVFAGFKNIPPIRLVFSDLTSENGQKSISSSAIRCFNLQGKDWLGKPFTKEVSVKKGEIQALWIGVDIKENTSPGVYTGKVSVQADGLKTEQVTIRLKVENKLMADRGYDELFRLSRLNWLDSDIGLDDKVFKPYSPVTLDHQTVGILGRTLQFGNNGLPEKIVSTFAGSNDRADGTPKDILSSPVQLVTITGGQETKWKGNKPKIVQKTSGAVAWTVQQNSKDLNMNIHAKMECDGYVNYTVTITARNSVVIDDIQLKIPYAQNIATYMMGLGFKTGFRPKQWSWKWDKDRANNMIWVGDMNAGMQCKLKHETPDWSLYDLKKTGTYKDWSNNGLGGCEVLEETGSYLFKAYTGKKALQPGEVLHLNFGLLITPVKTLDNAHFSERYFQADPPVNTWMRDATTKGANVMNIHQGNIMNPYINYPFIATDTLKNFITAARQKNIRSKVYYTVRELSNYTKELWALRSLGDEIFTPGIGAQIADQFADDGAGGNLYSSGGSWLVEHLRTKYDAAWHSPLQSGGDWDMSIRTQGLSRWHNYYLEGLGWLVKNTGVRGIYLDGVGYDREIMKRVRKVLDNAADSCLIDFHSGNNFQPAYGLGSTANTYMELFPSINSLWLGEMFNYNENPEYWLVECSGLPFGLFGEMLSNCGNPYRGMVYGMTSRLGWTSCDPSALWKVWDSFGISDARMIGYWDKETPVKSNQEQVKVTIYQKEDQVMIAYAGWGKKDLPLKLDINWKSLAMEPAKVNITAPEIPGFQQQKTYSSLDNIEVPAGKGGLIIIKKY